MCNYAIGLSFCCGIRIWCSRFCREVVLTDHNDEVLKEWLQDFILLQSAIRIWLKLLAISVIVKHFFLQSEYNIEQSANDDIINTERSSVRIVAGDVVYGVAHLHSGGVGLLGCFWASQSASSFTWLVNNSNLAIDNSGRLRFGANMIDVSGARAATSTVTVMLLKLY
ncbi:hypothetical protein Tco_0375551 [Tanacetum coccineum]